VRFERRGRSVIQEKGGKRQNESRGIEARTRRAQRCRSFILVPPGLATGQFYYCYQTLHAVFYVPKSSGD